MCVSGGADTTSCSTARACAARGSATVALSVLAPRGVAAARRRRRPPRRARARRRDDERRPSAAGPPPSAAASARVGAGRVTDNDGFAPGATWKGTRRDNPRQRGLERGGRARAPAACASARVRRAARWQYSARSLAAVRARGSRGRRARRRRGAEQQRARWCTAHIEAAPPTPRARARTSAAPARRSRRRRAGSGAERRAAIVERRQVLRRDALADEDGPRAVGVLENAVRLERGAQAREQRRAREPHRALGERRVHDRARGAEHIAEAEAPSSPMTAIRASSAAAAREEKNPTRARAHAAFVTSRRGATERLAEEHGDEAGGRARWTQPLTS